MEYRIVTPEEIVAFRNIRLESLRVAAGRMSQSFAVEVRLPLQHHLTMLTENVVMGAYEADTLVGILLGTVTAQARINHRAMAWGMYIKESIQNRSVGYQLMMALLAELADRGVCQVLGAIAADNPASLRMVEKAGFVQTYRERNGLRAVDGFGFTDVVHVIRYLDEPLHQFVGSVPQRERVPAEAF